MTSLEIRKKLHQQIDQLLPEQLGLLVEFVDFLRFKNNQSSNLVVSEENVTGRQPGLHPGAFVMSDDFDEPLPDSFWLGEE